MMFVGVDGCKKGWFVVKLTDGVEWETRVFENIDAIWAKFRNAAVILIDIPIGLKEHGPMERECDLEARRFLGRGRASSVFRVPCRKAVYAPREKASEINSELTGKRLSPPVYSILSKIREVDEFLSRNGSSRLIVREIHPEICFWALSGFHPMKYRKKRQDGVLEREKVLQSVYPLSKEIIDRSYNRKYLSKDDVLDALAAAITAKLGFNRFFTIPENPPIDSNGLRMEMVYFIPEK